MKRALLKAQAKKQKYLKRIEKIRKEEDSDGYLSSDNEEEVSDSMVSKVLENQFFIVKYLGKGSFSKTWMVYDFLDDRFLALKIFEDKYDKEYNLELENFRRFKGEHHENVINFYGCVECNLEGKYIRGLLLELLGDNIDVLLKEEYDEDISIDLVKGITRDILKGLDFIHSHRLVHNDMKFDNVLISKPNDKILEYIEKIKSLNIHQYYEQQINELTPQEIQMLDRKKRKMVKRKIKEKANKETIKKFRNDIIKINNSSLENLKLNIQEIDEGEDKDEEEPKKEENIVKTNYNLENLSVKIIDLGNAEIIGKMDSDEILARSYRPPENIINSYYDNKADIWVVGCMLYELFNGNSLFDLSDFKGKSIEKDRFHMALMFDVLGKIPKDMAMDCEFSEDIFDNKGRVIKNKGIETRDIKSELCERIKLETEECDEIYNLLTRILDYNPRTRPTCKEILESEWYSKCD